MTLFRRSVILALALATVAAILPAAAGAGFRTGMTASNNHGSGSNEERNLWFNRTKQTGAKVFRIDVGWRSVAPVKPVAPENPASYDLSGIDDMVARAQARGFEVLMTVFLAPDWAEGSGRTASAGPGTWKPNPSDFAAFGKALATRYDGAHGVGRVKYFEAWNEPNLGTFLTPQWSNGNLASVSHYRKMLNAFYAAVKSVRGDNVVLAAGTAPYGDDVRKGGQGRTRPLQFYRELMCLKRTKNKKAGKCTKAKFDIAAHHPINRSGSPTSSARDPDDVTTPDVKNLIKAVRYAEKKKTILPSRRGREIWGTEIWIETNPPDKKDGVPLKKAGDWMAETLYLLYKQGMDVVINYRIQDDLYAPTGGGNEAISLQGGLWYHDSVRNGAKKGPVYTAFRFPFVTERKSKKKVAAWGKAPRGGKLKIERKKGKGWKTVKTIRAKNGKVFKTKLKLKRKGKQKLRARIGKERSNTWKQR